MKKLFFCLIVVIATFGACSSNADKSESMSEPAMDESKYAASKSDSVSAVYDDAAPMESEKEKLEDISALKNQKKSPVVNQNPANQADTVYLKNVRISKKFIKTADLSFKVKNVESITHKIESMTLKLGGFVQQSAIVSNVVSEKDIAQSADSLMRVTEFYVNNQMIIRVPSIYFDSVLTEISKLYIYLNNRNVKTEDVSTTFLRNKLKAEKRAEYEKRIKRASDKGNPDLDDIVNAERTASDLADMAIDKKIDNYELQDRIDYSTITLNFYQANAISREMIGNTLLSQFKPGFWTRAWEAIASGWDTILDLLIGLLYLWPLYIIAIAIYYLVKYIRKRFKKSA
ncbi:MAG: DUF4349 domain-containing protein [Bacteroidales bacterium]